MREDDIREVMAEEASRGKKQPVQAAARKLKSERLRTVKELLLIRDREEIVRELTQFGVKPGSPEFEAALRAWREARDA